MPTRKTARADARSQTRRYLDALPAASRKMLMQIRGAVRAVAPRAVEHFSYGIPGYRLDDEPLVWYAAFSQHVSIFPMTPRIRAAHADALAGYEMSKGTVRFPLGEKLPVTLVKKLVKARAADARGEAKARAAKKARRARA